VLIVEDNPDDLLLVLNALKRGGFDPQHFRVMDADAMRDALQAKTWDIVLSDYALPSFSGIAALRLVREMGLDLPFIIISGTIDDASAVSAMKAGAHDYLMKDNLIRLGAAVERELKEAESRAARRSAEAQLLGFEKMASLGSLAAGVAHEINNPLAYALMNLELSLEAIHGPGAQQPEDLEKMLLSTREGMMRVKEIVGDLKDFSRAREGATQPVDLATSMDTALKLVLHELRHRATVVKDYQAAPPVEASPGRLGQVFMNLLVNAAQAMEPGQAAVNRLSLRIRAVEKNVEAEIIDTGKGISPENLKKIFEPFFTTKTQGTGLGLPLCEKLVKEMGGEIMVSSALGSGTLVRLRLPAAKRPLEAGASSSGPSKAPSAFSRRGRILVLDDEVALAEVIQKYLGRWHDVTVLGDGMKGYELLKQDQDFDLVLSDMTMPEMSGAELYVKLSQFKPGLEKRIAFLTGGGVDKDSVNFLESIPNLRIEKPFKLSTLYEVVELMLKA
jgi:signal transduction histidine kinase